MNTEDLHPKQWTPRVILGIVFVALLYHWEYTSVYLTGLLRGLTPVLTAAVMSLLLYAPMRFLDTHLASNKVTRAWPAKLRRALSYVAVGLLFLLVLYLLGRFIIPMVITMLTELMAFMRQTDLVDQVREALHITPEQWESTFGSTVTMLSNIIQHYAQDMVTILVNATTSALSFLLYVVLAFYFLASRDRIRTALSRVIRALLQPARAQYLISAISLASNTLTRWFGYQCLEALILGTETFAGMMIFGMPYAAPLACLTAFMQMIPYLGGWISFIVGFLTMLTVNLKTAIVFGIMLFVLQQIEGMVVNPHLVGGAVGLPPYLSLAAVVTGSALFGVVGMFLSVPICSVLYTLAKAYIVKRENAKKAPAVQTAAETEEKDADTLSGSQ